MTQYDQKEQVVVCRLCNTKFNFLGSREIKFCPYDGTDVLPSGIGPLTPGQFIKANKL